MGREEARVRESWSGGETGMQAVWGRGRSMTCFQVVSFRPADVLVERNLQLEEEFWSSRDSWVLDGEALGAGMFPGNMKREREGRG